MAKSTFLINAVLNAALRATAYTGAATVYVSLHTGAPALVGSNEVAGNAYARVAAAFGAPAGGAVANTGVITFPAPNPAAWGNVTYIGIWDALAAGNFLYGFLLTNAVVTSIGVPVEFEIGALAVTEA